MKKYVVLLLVTTLTIAAMDEVSHADSEIKVHQGDVSSMEGAGTSSEENTRQELLTKAYTALDPILKEHIEVSSEEFIKAGVPKKFMFLSKALCNIIQSSYWVSKKCSSKNLGDLFSHLSFILKNFRIDPFQEYMTGVIAYSLQGGGEEASLEPESYRMLMNNPMQTLVKFDLPEVFHIFSAFRPNTFNDKDLLQKMLSYHSIHKPSLVLTLVQEQLQRLALN